MKQTKGRTFSAVKEDVRVSASVRSPRGRRRDGRRKKFRETEDRVSAREYTGDIVREYSTGIAHVAASEVAGGGEGRVVAVPAGASARGAARSFQ